MPLSEPALRLALPPDPRSAGQARRWVAARLDEIGRADLADGARLAISELVTNAVLHAHTEIEIEIHSRGARAPRIGVCDHSTRRLRPRLLADDADIASNNGKGLALVAAVSADWGVEPWLDGKRIWFVPVADGEDPGRTADLAGPRSEIPPLTAPLDVYLHDVPVEMAWRARLYYRDLRRETVLVLIQPESEQHVPPEVVDLARRLEKVNPMFLGDEQVLDRAYMAGSPTVTMHYQTRVEERDDCLELTELFDRAVGLCRAGLLLTVPPPPEYVAVQHWMFDEMVRQIDGGDPISWTEATSRRAGATPPPP